MDQTQKKTLAPKLYRLADLLEPFDSFADRLDQARATGLPMGPTTGIELLDRELCGCLQPGLHVLKGDTGAGKSAFAQQLAASCQSPALYVSCEMSALELLRRHTARVTETYLSRFKDPKHNKPLPAAQAKELVRRAIADAPGLVLIDATRAFAPPDYLRDQAELLKQDYEAEHTLIVIDSLHSWARGIQGEEYARLELAIDSLQSLAAALSCPILCIAEQTKEANKGSNPGALASAGHRAIGYGAESVLSLNLKDPKAKPDALGEKAVTLVLNKNRNGAAGTPIELKFHGGFMRFTEA